MADARKWLGSQVDPLDELTCLGLSCDRDEVQLVRIRALYGLVGDEAAWDRAQQERVAGTMGHALADAHGGWGNIPTRWGLAHEELNARIMEYMGALDRVAKALWQRQIPMVGLKNAGIARGIFRCAGCSPMGDLDVLVDQSHFLGAHQVMVDLGFQFEFRSPLEVAEIEEAMKGGGSEYWTILPSGRKLWFELQWRPVAGRWIRPDQEPSGEALLNRSISIPDSQVRLLCPEDNLIQVCLHTAKHTYLRAPGFRLHTDVDRITRFQTVNWEIFVERVEALKVRCAVYFSLKMSRDLLNAPIPEWVIQKLSPGRLKVILVREWLKTAGLFKPDAHKFGRIGYILFTSILYDNVYGLFKGMFPDSAWMKGRYGFRSNWLLPVYHFRRILSLLMDRILS